MPHLDGLEVLHWLRHRHNEPNIAVYLLTSSDDPANRHRAAADGATGYLLKAARFDELIQNLDCLIAKTNGQRLEEAGEMDATMAESAYLSESAVEMAVV